MKNPELIGWRMGEQEGFLPKAILVVAATSAQQLIAEPCESPAKTKTNVQLSAAQFANLRDHDLNQRLAFFFYKGPIVTSFRLNGPRGFIENIMEVFT